jgi:hypothetical protein
MRIDEIVSDADTDPALYDLLMRLHKGATAAFNAKKTAQVLNLFDGWTMTKATLLKPSNETREINNRVHVSIDFPDFFYNGKLWRKAETRQVGLHASSKHDQTRLTVTSFSEQEAKAHYTEVAKLEVSSLPDPKTVKPDTFIVMNLTDPVAVPADEDSQATWTWSFDLFRKCSGYTIGSPDGQSFDVVGPVQVLGYAGTKDFAAFFNWALTNTNLEALVNAKLGLSKHVKAADRPRVPVGGQTIGTCAICDSSQVVRNGVMVAHGYRRPGVGYLIGECFGVGRKPYEVSNAACVEYIPHLVNAKEQFETRLANMTAGKIASFVEKKRNYRTNRDEEIVINRGDKRFDEILKSHIANVSQQIKYVTADIATMQAKVTNWKLGALRRNEG